jgi:hypothetical protein
MTDILGACLGLWLAYACFGLLMTALKTNTWRARGWKFSKERHPVQFWLGVASTAIFVAIGAIGAILLVAGLIFGI